MGSGLTKAGVVLLTAGCLLAIVFFILGLVFYTSDREHKVLDENDFSSSGYDSYRAYIDDSDLGSDISISIRSNVPGEEIRFSLTIEDPWGWEAYDDYGYESTPFDIDLTLENYMSGDWKFTIEFDYYDHSIYDVDISVNSHSLTTGEAGICCGLMIMPGIGIVMAVTGLILLIVGITNKKDASKREFRDTRPGQQYGRAQPQGGPGGPYGAQYQRQAQQPAQTQPGMISGHQGRPPQYGAPHQGQVQQPVQTQPGMITGHQGRPPQYGAPPQRPAQQTPQRQVPQNGHSQFRPVQQTPQGPAPVQPGGQGNIRLSMLKVARGHEKTGNFVEATRIYEQMELFDDAERCVRRQKGLPPKENDPVNVLKRIKNGGMHANYMCPFCSRTTVVDGTKLGKSFCDSCGKPIDFDLLSQV